MTVSRRAFVLASLAAMTQRAQAQGYAGLGSEAEGFALPTPGYRFDFPADHGPHPMFRIEWWYLTANLRDSEGRDFGLQWTLFRSALQPGETVGWHSPQVWMGHAAVTTPESHHFAEKYARGGIGQAGVTATPFAAWIDQWQMAGADPSEVRLQADGTDFAYDVRLKAEGPLVFHGQDGYSVKSADGQASYYYSQPHYAVTGRLDLPTGALDVTGRAWMDREWSSQPLAPDQSGWDWFSLVFDDGVRLMAFRLRGGRGDFTSATWIDTDGVTTAIPDGRLTLTPRDVTQVAGREVPTTWDLTLAERDLSVTVQAINPQSWMGTSFAYWEGPVAVTGSRTGRGYLEMTGY
ncbi:MAG: lipocalin-like domain-containing protein [Paracoccaceae bacterium]